MEIKNIVLTEEDHGRLQRLIRSRRHHANRDAPSLKALELELDRATVVRSKEIPDDVVTMNSRVRVKDLDRGEEVVYQIVFPADADASRNRISVLAPLGTGLLGYRAGTVFEWPVPSGVRRLHIVDVEYQPESTDAAA
jgi:regulator of nucleoside diphosphate kinase